MSLIVKDRIGGLTKLMGNVSLIALLIILSIIFRIIQPPKTDAQKFVLNPFILEISIL